MDINLAFVKKNREAKHLSMQKMAELLGFKTSASYFNYENGNRKFKAWMLPVLAKTFGCSIEELYQ